MELKGQFVTIGSDAHKINKVGWRLNEALELANLAGIPYLATFDHMKPTFIKI
ncbi:MAG: hypothetical protein AB9907_08715 [Flexilinea sp.]